MPDPIAPNPDAPRPGAVPEFLEPPGLTVTPAGHTRSQNFPAEKMWVSQRVNADDNGDDAYVWVLFNRFKVDVAERTELDWKADGTSTGEFRTVELGNGMCQREQQQNEIEYSYQFALLLQYYEQWVTDLKLETYYEAILNPVSAGGAVGLKLGGLFGAMKYTAAATAIESGAAGVGATMGTGAIAGGTAAGLATFVGAFMGTTAVMREIKSDTNVGATGWEMVGKWRHAEQPTGKTRTRWVAIGEPFECTKKRPITGGEPVQPKEKIAVGAGATPVQDEQDRTRGLPWWIFGAGLAVLVVILALVVSGGGGDASTAPADSVATQTVPDATQPPPATDSVSTAPAVTTPPSTAPPSTVPPSTMPPYATRAGVTGTCASVRHSPADGYPASPSFVVFEMILFPTAGVFPNGALLTVVLGGGDITETMVVVGQDGVTEVIVPISRFTEVTAQPTELTAGGLTIPVDSELLVADVDAAEGPLGGCTPPSELDPGTLADLLRAADAGDYVDAASDLAPAPGDPNGLALPSVEDDLAPYQSFFDEMARAHAEADGTVLFGFLHSSVIERYGTEQCKAYLETVLGGMADPEVLGGTTEAWDFPLDGRTTTIGDATTLQVEADWQGDRFVADVHVAPIDGQLRSFADCGDPID